MASKSGPKRGTKKAKEEEATPDNALVSQLKAEISRLRDANKRALKRSRKPPIKKARATRHELTVVIPDSHGEHIDIPSRDAFLADLASINPERIVMLGDHLDAGGTFSAHQRSYTKELVESYDADITATNEFLDLIQSHAPNARIDYIEGNHESHCNRWVARNFTSYRDAQMILGLIGPKAVLRLEQRGIAYYHSEERYHGLSVPGTIKIGKLFYTHGISAAKHAAAVHLERFGASVMLGHIHRAQSYIGRTVTSDGIGAWCPGTLAKLQPLYAHTNPTNWSHGYGIVTTSSATGNFSVMLIPILEGRSMLLGGAITGRNK